MIASLLLSMASAVPAAVPPVVAVPVVVGTSPSKEAIAAVDHLLDQQNAESGYKAMIPQVMQLVLPELARDNAGQEAAIRQILLEELSSIGQQLWPEMRQKIRDIYLAKFSAEELREMSRFLDSPVGKKMTRETPDIQLQMMAFGRDAGRAAVSGAMPRILDRMRAANLKIPTGT